MPAKVMGVERDYGTLEPGKYADVIGRSATRYVTSMCFAIRR